MTMSISRTVYRDGFIDSVLGIFFFQVDVMYFIFCKKIITYVEIIKNKFHFLIMMNIQVIYNN